MPSIPTQVPPTEKALQTQTQTLLPEPTKTPESYALMVLDQKESGICEGDEKHACLRGPGRGVVIRSLFRSDLKVTLINVGAQENQYPQVKITITGGKVPSVESEYQQIRIWRYLDGNIFVTALTDSWEIEDRFHLEEGNP